MTDEIKKIVVLVSKQQIDMINESRKTRGEPARKDSPHFPGDILHAHKKLPGGYEVAWDREHNRRHPNKFPADDKIPKAAKIEIAKLLKIDPNLLESFQGFDEIEGEDVFIVREKRSISERIIETLERLDKRNS